MHCTPWRLAAALSLLTAVACRPDFDLKKLTTNEALYGASLKEYQQKRWDNAVSGFEKLTADLPARDTLLPRSYWYLASAHQHIGENLLAAQSFSRLVESFPEDSLADDAGLEAARSYKRMWRKPQLDPTYGETALASYNTLIGLYPTSPLIPAAQKDINELENWFAIKDFDAGMYYMRMHPHAYDSAILYFKDALTKYANTPKAHDAGIRLVEAYKGIRYFEDASELCAQLRQRYPNDREVVGVCTGVAPPAVKADSTPPAPPPDKPAKPPTS
ncbi:MAG: outer rane assembly lipoprotein YfiO [Gemmatimonadetes bacterium]|nr:outer rane assembly lipoprotein YfiO [Gemmatimonadota bacterium]